MPDEPNWLEFFEDRERLYAGYYLAFAEQNARRDAEAYERLEGESGNLLRVGAWLGEYDEAEGILRLAEALWEKSDFLRARGFMQRGLPLLEKAREAARQLGDLEAEFVWLEALANVHWSVSNFSLAQPLYDQVLDLAQKNENLRLKAQAQLGMGRLQMDMGHLEYANSLLKQALQNYQYVQDYEGEIMTLTYLGNLLSLQGDFAGAEAYLKQGYPLVQAQQDRYNETALSYALGYAAALAQEWPKAISHFEIASRLAHSVGDRILEARSLFNLGEAWLELGNAQKAVFLLEEALTLQKASDDILTKAFNQFYLGKAYNALNRCDKSLAQLSQVYPYLLETCQAPITGALAVEANWIIADNHLKQDNINLARVALQNVLNLPTNYRSDIRQSAKILLELLDNR